MADEYPKMLFRAADEGELMHDLPCETLIVEDADEEAAAKGDGWAETPAEAHSGSADKPKRKRS